MMVHQNNPCKDTKNLPAAKFITFSGLLISDLSAVDHSRLLENTPSPGFCEHRWSSASLDLLLVMFSSSSLKVGVYLQKPKSRVLSLPSHSLHSSHIFPSILCCYVTNFLLSKNQPISINHAVFLVPCLTSPPLPTIATFCFNRWGFCLCIYS